MKTKLNSLGFHLWVNFIAFSVIIFFVLFLSEHIMFNYLYKNFEEAQFTKLAETMSSYTLTEENYKTLDALASENNIVVIIFDDDELFYISKNADIFNSGYTYDELYDEAVDYMGQSYDIIISTKNSVSLRNMNSFIYGAKLENETNTFIYAASPQKRSKVSTAVNNVIFLITTPISFFLGGLLAALLSRRMSKPLSMLTKEAKELGKGNYDVEFDIDGFTEVQELGITLNDAKEELRQINDLQKELIANISHDLRTPLTVIKSYAEMIKDISGDNPEMREKHLNTIISETDRLSSLVNDVLNLSKIQSKTVSLNLEEINLKTLMQEMYMHYKLVFEENKYEVNLDLIDATVMTDKSLLEQVIQNFVTNAITYTNDKIIFRIKEEETKYVCQIIDNGCGIKTEDLEHIWDRYYRSKENHVRSKVGTGIGLSICKNVLEMLGYEYGVDTSEAGSTFYFKVDK